MTAEEYIAIYGASLSEADKRYIRAFGAPSVPAAGPARNPSTPGLTTADYSGVSAEMREAEARAHRANMDRLDREAESY